MTAPIAEQPGFLRRHWGKLTLFLLVTVPLAILAAWTAIAFAYTYSNGERTGYAQKLSRKGWLCKTWEGEIAMATAPGVMPEKFAYTVRSDSVAQAIQALDGQRVALTYEQHKFLPTSCFGETEYFVSGVRRVATP